MRALASGSPGPGSACRAEDTAPKSSFLASAEIRRADSRTEGATVSYWSSRASPSVRLITLLAGRERQKGSPLTEHEVLEVRDSAACTRMPLSQAEMFYASLDGQMPIPRLNPERIWEEWQEVRVGLING